MHDDDAAAVGRGEPKTSHQSRDAAPDPIDSQGVVLDVGAVDGAIAGDHEPHSQTASTR